MQNIVYTKSKLDQIPISDRCKYLFDDELVATIKGFSKDYEDLVSIKNTEVNFHIEPFWEDEVFQVEDSELQELLDSEARAFRNYIARNPDFETYIRPTVLQKLQTVQATLNKSYNSRYVLVIKAVYRPLEVQRELFQDSLNFFRNKFPDRTESELYKLNLQYVADPDNFIPPHSTGGAVDLYLYDKSLSKPVDMGSPINYPDNSSWTYFSDLSDEQKSNRLFLTKLMLDHGFANLASEWWHYSYGDQYWAMFYDYSECLYNQKSV